MSSSGITITKGAIITKTVFNLETGKVEDTQVVCCDTPLGPPLGYEDDTYDHPHMNYAAKQMMYHALDYANDWCSSRFATKVQNLDRTKTVMLLFEPDDEKGLSPRIEIATSREGHHQTYRSRYRLVDRVVIENAMEEGLPFLIWQNGGWVDLYEAVKSALEKVPDFTEQTGCSLPFDDHAKTLWKIKYGEDFPL